MIKKKKLGKKATISPYRSRLDYKGKVKKAKKGATPPSFITT